MVIIEEQGSRAGRRSDQGRREVRIGQAGAAPAAAPAVGGGAGVGGPGPSEPSASVRRAMAGYRQLRATPASAEAPAVLEAAMLRAARAVLGENREASELELEAEIAALWARRQDAR